MKFLEVVFPVEKITLPGSRYIETIKGEKTWSWKSGEFVKVRFKYYGCQEPYIGTIYTDLRDGTISDNSPFYENQGISQVVEHLTSGYGTIIFWIVWISLTDLAVFGFYYLENDWLEDRR